MTGCIVINNSCNLIIIVNENASMLSIDDKNKFLPKCRQNPPGIGVLDISSACEQFDPLCSSSVQEITVR